MSTQTLRRMIACSLLLVLSSCDDWSRWRSFKRQCEKEYATKVEVHTDAKSGWYLFKDPLLTQADVRQLCQGRLPTLSEKDPVDGHLKEQFRCQRTGAQRQGEQSDLIFWVHYDAAGMLSRFEFPLQFVQMCANDATLQETAKAIMQGDVGLIPSTSLNGEMVCSAAKGMYHPTRAMVEQVYGPADKVEVDDDEAELLYEYSIMAPPGGDGVAERGMSITFYFEAGLLTEVVMQVCSINVNLEIDAE